MLSRALTRPLPLLRPAANGLRSYATAAPAAAGSPSALGDIKLSNVCSYHFVAVVLLAGMPTGEEGESEEERRRDGDVGCCHRHRRN
ncbi:hypothetical protein BT69DRAFT_1290196, partial [Atractiella rhizophila]